MTDEQPGWGDAVRLATGTFTAFPVPPPRQVTRRVAGRTMLLAPVTGLVIGLAAAVVLFVGRELFYSPLLPAALTIAFLALITRAIHLDGLADTADGLGAASRGREVALDVMRRGDIGPFGVIALTLVLILQTLSLATAVTHGFGTLTVVAACVVGRLAATWGCVTGVPSARADGLGADVAGSVSRTAAAVVTSAVFGAVVVAGAMVDDDGGPTEAVLGGVAVLVGLALGLWLVRLAIRRFGGISGDVLGAAIELAALGAMLVLAA